MRTLGEILHDELETSHPLVDPDFDDIGPVELVAILAEGDEDEIHRPL